MPHRLDREPGSFPKPESNADKTNLGAAREALQLISNQVELTPDQIVEAIYNARVDHLKQIGELRQASDITSEEELDDHFDELSRVYRQTWLSLGLPWPPPMIDARQELVTKT